MSAPSAAIAQTTHTAATAGSPPADDERDAVTRYGVSRYDRLEARLESRLGDEELVSETDTQGRSPETIAAGMVAILQSVQTELGIRPTGRSIATSSAFSTVADQTESAYRRGVAAARSDLADAGLSIQTTGPRLTQRLGQPSHQRTLATLFENQARHYRNLADDVLDEVQGELTQALREGADRREVVSRVRERVEKVGGHRARLIGETEPARAYHEATLSEYELLGVREVELSWNTVGDLNVCEDCLAGSSASPYQLEEARGLIPHHPVCRCWWSARKESIDGTRR